MAMNTLPAVIESGNIAKIDRRMLMNGAMAGGAVAMLPTAAHASYEQSVLLAAFQEFYGLQMAYRAHYETYVYVDIPDFPRYARFNALWETLWRAEASNSLDITIKAAFAEAVQYDSIEGEAARDACKAAEKYLRDSGLLPDPITFTSAEFAELERLNAIGEIRELALREECLEEKRRAEEEKNRNFNSPKGQESWAMGIVSLFRDLNPGQKTLAFIHIKRDMGVFD